MSDTATQAQPTTQETTPRGQRKVRLGTNDGSAANLARYYIARARARLPAAPAYW